MTKPLPSPPLGVTVSGGFEPDEHDAAERRVQVERWNGAARSLEQDSVAHEEPLEIQIEGVGIAVLMRTPGHDEELALGYLLSERAVEDASQVISIRHSSTAREPEADGNTIQVVLGPGVERSLERFRRSGYASASCGVCGKATIAAALLELSPLSSALSVSADGLRAMPFALRSAQSAFDTTGGLHAAGLFTPKGELVLAREDVGRHNAVDKVLGAAARRRITPGEHVLFVSGRTSLEIVQKAAACGVPIVAAVSAPTSLAVRYAASLGVTLVGFVRGERLNVYAHAERVLG
jgi:FdhD protein